MRFWLAKGKSRVHIQWVSYGAEATDALRKAVDSAKGDDPLRPVTIVVPSQTTGVAARRALAGAITGGKQHGIAGLNIATVYKLASQLGGARMQAQGRQGVTTALVAAAVRQVLRREPGMFAPVNDHPSTVAAFCDVHRELQMLDAAQLEALAAASARAAEVVRITGQVAQTLNGWHSEADLLAAARQTALAGQVADDVGQVIVYLPQRLPAPVRHLLVALDEACPVQILAGSSGVRSADEPVARQLQALIPNVPHSPQRPPDPATAILSVSDPEEEVRQAVHRIIQAAHQGTPFERMALCYPSARPYARIAHEQLSAAEIPMNGLSPRPLRDRVAGRWVLDLLALAGGRLARSEVLQVLAAPPAEPVDQRGRHGRWADITRVAGVVEGRSDFDHQLDRYARRCEREASECERRGAVEQAAYKRGRAEDTRHLRAAALQLIDAALVLKQRTAWKTMAEQVTRLMHQGLGTPEQREHWPEPERRAADQVERELESLPQIDQLDEPCTLVDLQQVLGIQLERALREGRVGAGVMVGPLSAPLGAELDLVVCVGLAEGVLPVRPTPDPLLPDRDRRRAGDLTLNHDNIARQQRELGVALAASAGERVLITPRSDLRDRTQRSPSRWLLEHAAQLSTPDGREGATKGGPMDDRALPGPGQGQRWFTHHASFSESLGDGQRPATTTEWRLRRLPHEQRSFVDRPTVLADPVLAASLPSVQARGGSGLSRFDGLVEGATAVTSPGTVGPVSATALQDWVACPHGYFLQHVLGVDRVEAPEEQLQISHLDRGSLFHEALEQWLRTMIRENRVPQPTEPWPDDARTALVDTFMQLCDQYQQDGVVGHETLWEIDRLQILRDVGAFCDHDDRWRALHGATPVDVEIPFGMGPHQPKVVVDVPGGPKVALRGKIDRIDRAADGVIVTDYKTGKAEPYERITAEDDPTQAGRHLQLPVYAFAAQAIVGRDTQVRAGYHFITSRGAFKWIEPPSMTFAMDCATEVLRVIATAMGTGLFPQRPDDSRQYFNECPSCQPDGLSQARAWRTWKRTHTDPQLADYVALVGAPQTLGRR